MHRGYIKLFRKLEDWEWYDDLQLVGFFVHLILSANYKESKYHGHTIPRGSLVFGRKEASKRFKVGEQVIRTMLTRLKSTSEITIKITSKFSVICIVNFERYQDKTTSTQPAKNHPKDENSEKSTIKITSTLYRENNHHLTSNPTASQPASNQHLTTSKEVKNVKNIRITENLLSNPEGQKALRELVGTTAKARSL